MRHPLSLLIINTHEMHLHAEGWRGTPWHDFADGLGGHFARATLMAPACMDGGDQFDLLPLENLTLEITRVPASFSGYFRALGTSDGLKLIGRLASTIRRHDVVLLRIPDPFFPIVALICRIAGVPLAVAVTGDIARANRYLASRSLWKRSCGRSLGWVLRLLEWLSMAIRTDLLFAYGDAAGETYRRVARRTVVTREGTVPDSMINVRRVAPAAGRIRIVQAANYHENKNFGMLFRAAERLLARGHDIELHLAGDDASASVKAAVEAARLDGPLAGRIVEHGWLKQAELYALFQSSDIMTLTSFSEGWPRVVSEGAAFGLAIVATRVGGIPTFLKDGESGLLVPSNDDAALADAIERIITDPALRARLVAGGYEMARSGSRESIVNQWVEELVACRNRIKEQA